MGFAHWLFCCAQSIDIQTFFYDRFKGFSQPFSLFRLKRSGLLAFLLSIRILTHQVFGNIPAPKYCREAINLPGEVNRRADNFGWFGLLGKTITFNASLISASQRWQRQVFLQGFIQRLLSMNAVELPKPPKQITPHPGLYCPEGWYYQSQFFPGILSIFCP